MASGSTRQCPRCAMEIPTKARVCAYCKRRLKTSPLALGCLAIGGLAVVVILGTAFLSDVSSPELEPVPNSVIERQKANEKKRQEKIEAIRRANEEPSLADSIGTMMEEREERRKKAVARCKDLTGEARHRDPLCVFLDCPGYDLYTETAAKGKIAIGMNQCMVRIAWGEPDDTTQTVTAAGSTETWLYGDGVVIFDARGEVALIRQ